MFHSAAAARSGARVFMLGAHPKAPTKLSGSSLGVFGPDNRFRVLCANVATHPYAASPHRPSRPWCAG